MGHSTWINSKHTHSAADERDWEQLIMGLNVKGPFFLNVAGCGGKRWVAARNGKVMVVAALR